MDDIIWWAVTLRAFLMAGIVTIGTLGAYRFWSNTEGQIKNHNPTLTWTSNKSEKRYRDHCHRENQMTGMIQALLSAGIFLWMFWTLIE